MKKSLILSLSLAAPLFAGDPTLEPAPTIITPTPACNPLTLEMSAGYGVAMGDIFDGISCNEIDLYTIDATAVYAFNDKHAATLRLGYGFGDEALRGMDFCNETDVQTFSLMPGYRFTHVINEKWSVFAGANAGIAQLSVKNCFEAGNFRAHDNDSDWGFAYSVELGTSYKLAERWSVFASYGVFGSTADPELTYGALAVPVDNQNYHGFRLGVSHEF